MKLAKKLIANQKLFYGTFLVVAILAGFGVSYLASGGGSKNAVIQPKNCKDTCVSLLIDRASPDTLAVAVGSYVTFNSADGKSHELTLGDDKGSSLHAHSNPGSFDSGVFKSDESWRVQFKEEGTYKFTDKLNPRTNIIVLVYTAGKDYKIY